MRCLIPWDRFVERDAYEWRHLPYYTGLLRRLLRRHLEHGKSHPHLSPSFHLAFATGQHLSPGGVLVRWQSRRGTNKKRYPPESSQYLLSFESKGNWVVNRKQKQVQIMKSRNHQCNNTHQPQAGQASRSHPGPSTGHTTKIQRYLAHPLI